MIPFTVLRLSLTVGSVLYANALVPLYFNVGSVPRLKIRDGVNQ